MASRFSSRTSGSMLGDADLTEIDLGSQLETEPNGCGSKLHRRGYAGVGPCFHLPGFHSGYRFCEPQPYDLMIPGWFVAPSLRQGAVAP